MKTTEFTDMALANFTTEGYLSPRLAIVDEVFFIGKTGWDEYEFNPTGDVDDKLKVYVDTDHIANFVEHDGQLFFHCYGKLYSSKQIWEMIVEHEELPVNCSNWSLNGK